MRGKGAVLHTMKGGITDCSQRSRHDLASTLAAVDLFLHLFTGPFSSLDGPSREVVISPGLLNKSGHPFLTKIIGKFSVGERITQITVRRPVSVYGVIIVTIAGRVDLPYDSHRSA